MTINLTDAQARLPELIRGLAPGEELFITDNERPVAKIIGSPFNRFRPLARAPVY